jgi:hypothetical protein
MTPFLQVFLEASIRWKSPFGLPAPHRMAGGVMRDAFDARASVRRSSYPNSNFQRARCF